jgi:GT2 family glycosyltransferase
VTTPAVSVVIPTFQRCSSVRRALDALARQTIPFDAYEVLVSIDGSEDGTREMVASQRVPFPLRSVCRPNRGRAAARNAGAREARGELLVFLDDDMEASPGLLAAHIEAQRSGQEALGVAVVGAAPIVTRSSSPLTDYLARRFGDRLAVLAQPGRAVRFNEAYTGNLSVRRATLFQIGGFDETFRLYGHEDYEFALRLIKAGVRLVFSPPALALQHQEKEFPAVARDAMARGRTAVLFARKHPEVVRSLKLGAFAAETRKWRLLRAVLLGLTRRFGSVPDAVIRLMTGLEKRRSRRLDRYYAMALDYFYWVGVRAEQRESGPA